jgi:hypothetical protein
MKSMLMLSLYLPGADLGWDNIIGGTTDENVVY